jgi:hypothetical protein
MNRVNDGNYYRVRLRAEREAIQNATSDEARAVHRELAERYENLLAGGTGEESRPRLLLILNPASRPHA